MKTWHWLFLATCAAAAFADHYSPESIQQRIAPVGELRITQAQSASPAVAGEIDGEAVYNAACAACHAAGIAGAPKVGDQAAWAGRIAQGMGMLNAHAVEGFIGDAGVMPAKGGNPNLSDAEVESAVDYMVRQSQP